jgi:DNA-binding NtrC family response regulator
MLRYQPGGVTCELMVPLPEIESTTSLSAAEREGIETAGGTGGAGMAGKRVLIVEDEVLVALDIESALTDAGMVVSGRAGTLDAARRAVALGEFDAVLLDANLAGQPVLDLAAALQRQGVPFAFATGYGREGIAAEFRNVPVLSKPFTSEQLIGLMRRLLAA